MRALEKAPDSRYQAAWEFLRALEDAARAAALPGASAVTRATGPAQGDVTTRLTPVPGSGSWEETRVGAPTPVPQPGPGSGVIHAVPPPPALRLTTPPVVAAPPPGAAATTPAGPKRRSATRAVVALLALAALAGGGWWATMYWPQIAALTGSPSTPETLPAAPDAPTVPAAGAIEPDPRLATSGVEEPPAATTPEESGGPSTAAGAQASAAPAAPTDGRPRPTAEGRRPGQSPPSRSGGASRPAEARVSPGTVPAPPPVPVPRSATPSPAPPPSADTAQVFKDVRIVRPSGPEVEVELHLDPGRLNVTNVGGKHTLLSLPYGGIASAEYRGIAPRPGLRAHDPPLADPARHGTGSRAASARPRELPGDSRGVPAALGWRREDDDHASGQAVAAIGDRLAAIGWRLAAGPHGSRRPRRLRKRGRDVRSKTVDSEAAGARQAAKPRRDGPAGFAERHRGPAPATPW